MIDFLLLPIALIYLIVIMALFIYGLNLFYLTFLSFRERAVPAKPRRQDYRPEVTVQLPIYNELYVAERLIRKTAEIDYPKEKLEIQVLDDSTDETVRITRAVVSELQEEGFNIVHIHRTSREGYKSGALAAGLEIAKGEYIAIFDADFLPPKNFLNKTLPCFEDPSVGFVQTRWGHTNQDYSLITLLQSLSIDAHFMVEQFSRSSKGYWFNFNGSAGIWRRRTINSAGGWSSDTLSEDLDLSYRAYLAGWKGAYLRDVKSPAELPVSISAFRRQQHRWARGSLECALRHLPKVWASTISMKKKFQATIHLLGYTVHLLLVALVLLHPIMLFISLRYESLISLFGIGIIFNLAIFAQYTYLLSAQHHLGNRVWRLIPVLIFFASAGTGMMVNTMRAALEIFVNKKGTFERTPKFGITTSKQDWTRQRYQLRLDPIIFVEILLGILSGGTCLFAIQTGNWIIAFYAVLFCTGLLFVAGVTIYQALLVLHQQRKQQQFSNYSVSGTG